MAILLEVALGLGCLALARRAARSAGAQARAIVSDVEVTTAAGPPADRPAELPHPLQRHVGVLLIRVAAMVKQRIEQGMQECGLRPRHYAILQLLRTEGAVSQQAVGARLDIDPGTVVDLIDVLEERGLVERRRRVGDRRVYELHLTAAGSPMSEQIEPVLHSVEGTALAPLTAAELELLKDMLTRVVTQPPLTQARGRAGRPAPAGRPGCAWPPPRAGGRARG